MVKPLSIHSPPGRQRSQESNLPKMSKRYKNYFFFAPVVAFYDGYL
jgi:hypothetical protein